MTILEAVISEITPYTVEVLVVQKAILDHSLVETDTYTATNVQKTEVAKCAVTVLKKMISMTSESEGGFTVQYDVNALQKRISDITSEYGLSSSFLAGPTVCSQSHRW